jgi:hypothetical protein
MVNTRLLTHDQIEACLREAQSDNSLDPGSRSEIGICPVTELLELCERAKKYNPVPLASLKRSLGTITQEEIRCDSLLAIILPLDRQRLADSLFERDEQSRVQGLWAPGSDGAVRCMHSVRRLLLRPTEQIWWDPHLYDLAEEIYALGVEESDIT